MMVPRLRYSTKVNIAEFTHPQLNTPGLDMVATAASTALKFKNRSVTYPFRLAYTVPPRKFSLWNDMKRSHLKKVGSFRLQELLKDGAYNFPYQFYADATDTLLNAFQILSNHGQMSLGTKLLERYMISSLANEFFAGYESLNCNDMKVEFKWHEKPKISLRGFYFTYGPFPTPAEHVHQDWAGFITYIVPKEDAQFKSYPRQQEIVRIAAREGCHVRIDTQVVCDLEFVLKTRYTDIPLLRDHRRKLDVSFMSPHFNPWDEIFVLDGEDWKLSWNWKISDIDGVEGEKIAITV